MKKLFIFLMTLALIGCHANSDQKITRIGWMRSWTPVAQIVLSLKEKNDLNAQFFDFQYGPEINEAALGGSLDVVTLGVVPAMNLLAASTEWQIAAALLDFPVSVVVRKDFTGDTIEALRGKKVAAPFGGGSHPFVLSEFKKAGLVDGKDVTLVNIKPSEQLIALKTAEIDAAATWEPQTTLLIKEAGARLLSQGKHTGFVLVRRGWCKENDKCSALIKSEYQAAIQRYAANRLQIDQQFSQITKIPLEIVRNVQQFAPRLDLNVRPIDIEEAQRVADQMFEAKLLPRSLKVAQHVLIEEK
jgi:sulfonate transport system substrate-binding protein